MGVGSDALLVVIRRRVAYGTSESDEVPRQRAQARHVLLHDRDTVRRGDASLSLIRRSCGINHRTTHVP